MGGVFQVGRIIGAHGLPVNPFFDTPAQARQRESFIISDRAAAAPITAAKLQPIPISIPIVTESISQSISSITPQNTISMTPSFDYTKLIIPGIILGVLIFLLRR